MATLYYFDASQYIFFCFCLFLFAVCWQRSNTTALVLLLSKSVRIFGREKCWCGFNGWLCASHFRVRSLCAHSFEVAKHLLISNSCTSTYQRPHVTWIDTRHELRLPFAKCANRILPQHQHHRRPSLPSPPPQAMKMVLIFGLPLYCHRVVTLLLYKY